MLGFFRVVVRLLGHGISKKAGIFHTPKRLVVLARLGVFRALFRHDGVGPIC